MNKVNNSVCDWLNAFPAESPNTCWREPSNVCFRHQKYLVRDHSLGWKKYSVLCACIKLVSQVVEMGQYWFFLPLHRVKVSTDPQLPPNTFLLVTQYHLTCCVYFYTFGSRWLFPRRVLLGLNDGDWVIWLRLFNCLLSSFSVCIL